MTSSKELSVLRMLIDFMYGPRAEPGWSIKEFSTRLGHTSITETRAHIASIFDEDGLFGDANSESRMKVKRWLSDFKNAPPLEELFMVEVSCHCGGVRFTVDFAPAEVDACECSICRRYGALWAYYDEPQVKFSANVYSTDTYSASCNKRELSFHRCHTCGCVTHLRRVEEGRASIGVNAHMMPADIIADARFLRNGYRLD